ncbi:MAG: adenosylmethionine decarboxylase [Thermovirgaceae bacterium]|nr:adenosylmethionine decarboxylase [Synergistales bacterium]MDY0178484.1 adenosylmethionine decarboxylase [Synergistaceae bacterium]HRW87471.1 adenosylmethionine decarboxylase [Thermovirgaceae bacterium]MDD3133441.1 adenosylmethionine decarboxylase [Synergistales bacterium]MDD3829382.1 adenosylmethionine decarboxylase [Synergistales bacterium]
MKQNGALGRHILVEAYDCDPSALDDILGLERSMKEAAEAAGATVVESAFRKFEPHGVSGVLVISESHLTIHTWPEFGYAAIDLFTCGCNADPWKAFERLSSYLGSSRTTSIEILRGHISGVDA